MGSRARFPGGALRPAVRAALAALALASLAAGCGHRTGGRADGAPVASLREVVKPGAAAGMNVLLVTLDTVRQDRLGCYGYRPAETPNIDRLTRHGALFEDAVAPAPITLPSHATMLTGLYPPNHGVRDNGVFALDPAYRTLSETLSDAGYETAAFVSSFTVDARYGLNQGFERYDFAVTRARRAGPSLTDDRRDASDVTDAALAWLAARSAGRNARPFFAWVHYFDAHVPYDSPYASLERFRARPYDGQVAYVDVHLGRLLHELDARGLTRKTLIVVVSDHGEGLGEHGEKTHGVLLHEATMRVALLLSCPALFDAPYRIGGGVVSLADLRPTLEQLLGLPVSTPVDGMGLVTEVPPADRAVYIETMLPLYTANASPLTGMRRHRDKLVRGPTPQYYDLVADPGELRDLHAEAGDAVAELTRALEQVTAAFPGASETGTRTVTPEEAECLRSLGYLSAGASAGRNLPDVAALLRSQQLMDEAFAHLRAGRMAEALRSNAEARNLCGLFRDTVLQEVMILEQMGRREEAARAADDFLRQRPDAEVAIVQAQVYLRLGRYEEMERALAVAASVDPGNGSVHIVRGDRLCLEGRLEEALREYGEAIRVDGVRLGPVVEPQMARVRAAIQSRGR